MFIREEYREDLNSGTDLEQISQHIEHRTGQSLPMEALILDEDINVNPLLRHLRKQSLKYSDGRPALAKRNHVQVIHAAHIFDSTEDRPLIEWCAKHEYPLLVIDEDYKDKHHQAVDHWGIIWSLNYSYPHNYPRGFSAKVNSIFVNHKKIGFQNTLFPIVSPHNSSP
jgi:hypothetical protein